MIVGFDLWSTSNLPIFLFDQESQFSSLHFDLTPIPQLLIPPIFTSNFEFSRIEQELKLEEARLAQVRGERVQAEQKLKQRYNYNQDYSVIHPGQSQIHEVPDIPSPSQRSTHNRPTTDHQTEPRYTMVEKYDCMHKIYFNDVRREHKSVKR